MFTVQGYGANYIIDFLRGSASEKIVAAHKELKTYGIGKGLKKEEWQWMVQQLVYYNFLVKTEDQYATLKITEKGWKVLKGESELKLVMKKEKQEVAVADDLAYDKDLLKQLKSLRLDMADREHVPAYAIVSDSSIVELATYLPQNFEELRLVSGFGDYKVSRYGAPFVKLITDYSKEHNLTSKMQFKRPKRERKERSERTAASSTQQITYKMFGDGMSIEEIAQQRNLSTITVEGHLAKFVEMGELDVHRFVTKKKLDEIVEVIRSTGQTVAIKPIKDILGDDYSYGEIRLALGYYSKSLNGLMAQ